MENFIGKVINGDCVEVMKEIPDGVIDLVVTSCPYNVGIQYDTHIDNLIMPEYWDWTEKWLTKLYNRIILEIRYRKKLKELRKRDPFIYK